MGYVGAVSDNIIELSTSIVSKKKFLTMPLYEYACLGCGKESELLIRGSESPQCPECGGENLQRQLSVISAHVHAKGDLPVCEPPSPGGCGLPQCGTGGCQFG